MKTTLEKKVGLFVMLGLLLLALLLLQFSKGTSIFRPSYDILMRSTDVAGLKLNASVLMSGVQVGRVASIKLGEGGGHVIVTLRIYKSFPIHSDARFTVEQSGFLGDQYIAVVPTANKAKLFESGDRAEAEPAFNLQEVARSAGGFVMRLDETAKKLDEMIVQVRRALLNEETLTNMAVTVANLRAVSEKALRGLDSFTALVEINTPAFFAASSNLVLFTEELNLFADNLNGVLRTNSPGLNATVRNVEASTESLKSFMNEVNTGKGLAGGLVRNKELAANVSQIAENLSITTSNLNRIGLWGFFGRKKDARHDGPPPEPLRAPKENQPH